MKEEVLNKLVRYIEVTEDFVAREAPLVVQEILLRPWIDLLIIVPWLVFLFLMIFYAVRGLKKDEWANGEPGKDGTIGIVLSVVSLIISIPVILESATRIPPCLQAYFTPRLYILEYLANLA